jgi:cystathionine beta-lyase/cystathionine gamma-synthase
MPNSIFTQAVHAGEQTPQPDFKPVTTPIYPSVAYTYDSMETMDAIFGNERPGYVYRRYGNPTVAAFEEAMATLEGGSAAYATSSGMGAIHGALLAAGAKSGAHILASQDCYGATYFLTGSLLPQMGLTCTFADFTDLDTLRNIATETKPTILICETVSNPLLRVVDIEAVGQIARQVKVKLIVDSTFSTPYLCQPLSLGADFVVHSATKYIGGHDDVLAGVVVTSEDYRQTIFELEKNIGANISPFDAWLALRGLKTLPLRMRQHCENALTIARWLENFPLIKTVNYPGLASHPQHAVTRKLHSEQGFGGMLSFEISGGDQKIVFKFMQALKLIQPATTLGDVYSLALYPAMSSHRAMTLEQRQEVGISDSLVRLSVGIEDANDIIADLEQALETAG